MKLNPTALLFCLITSSNADNWPLPIIRIINYSPPAPLMECVPAAFPVCTQLSSLFQRLKWTITTPDAGLWISSHCNISSHYLYFYFKLVKVNSAHIPVDSAPSASLLKSVICFCIITLYNKFWSCIFVVGNCTDRLQSLKKGRLSSHVHACTGMHVTVHRNSRKTSNPSSRRWTLFKTTQVRWGRVHPRFAH